MFAFDFFDKRFVTFTCVGQISSVSLQMSHFHVTTRHFHANCGHLVDDESLQCSFCQHDFDGNDDIIRGFYLKITIADETAKIFAYSTGQTAIELLQISPDEFHELPEVILAA